MQIFKQCQVYTCSFAQICHNLQWKKILQWNSWKKISGKNLNYGFCISNTLFYCLCRLYDPQLSAVRSFSLILKKYRERDMTLYIIRKLPKHKNNVFIIDMYLHAQKHKKRNQRKKAWIKRFFLFFRPSLLELAKWKLVNENALEAWSSLHEDVRNE